MPGHLKNSRIADQQLGMLSEVYYDARSSRVVFLVLHFHSHFHVPWAVINYIGRVVSSTFDDHVFHILKEDKVVQFNDNNLLLVKTMIFDNCL